MNNDFIQKGLQIEYASILMERKWKQDYHIYRSGRDSRGGF